LLKKKHFHYLSKDGIHKIHAISWQNTDVKTVGILQLIHGMAEYIERYEPVAEYFANKGYLVVGNDHLGHGESVRDDSELGYFCKHDPATTIVTDVANLQKVMHLQNPELPYFILGHSMGSLVLRNYLCRFGKDIDGAIICGTAHYPQAIVGLGRFMTGIFKVLGLQEKKYQFLDTMLFSSNNKKTEKRTKFDWLCTDESVVDQYIEDDLCGFLFSVNGFDTLFQLVGRLNHQGYLNCMPKHLPVFFIAGKDDPVGAYGKSVRTAYSMFETIGMEKIEIKLYDGARHEILNEKIKMSVFEDVHAFLKKCQ